MDSTDPLERVLEIIDTSIDGWRNLERDVGLDAVVSIITVIVELERLRESVCHVQKHLPQS